MKRIICVILLCFSLNVAGQKFVIIKDGIDKLSMMAATIVDSTKIDEAVLSLKYRYSKIDTTKNIRNYGCDILMLVGERFVRQSDLHLHYSHLLLTEGVPDTLLIKLRRAVGEKPSNLFSDILLDCRSGKLTVRCGDYFEYDCMKRYNQPLPKLSWVIHDEEQLILGYSCRKATTDYGGRTWEVWFTKDIPFSFGPWKLQGLPGLILAACDKDGGFVFECTEVRKSNEPIMNYRFISEQNLKTLRNYLRYERKCFEHPFETYAKGEEAYIVYSTSDGHKEYLDKTWTIPYDPIEYVEN